MIARFGCFTENLTRKTCQNTFDVLFQKMRTFRILVQFCCFSEYLKAISQNKTWNSEHYSFKCDLERKTTTFSRKCKMIVFSERRFQNPAKWSPTKMIGGSWKSLEPTKMIDHFSGEFLYAPIWEKRGYMHQIVYARLKGYILIFRLL